MLHSGEPAVSQNRNVDGGPESRYWTLAQCGERRCGDGYRGPNRMLSTDTPASISAARIKLTRRSRPPEPFVTAPAPSMRSSARGCAFMYAAIVDAMLARAHGD